jgi:Protein of unknown function (DUF3307)
VTGLWLLIAHLVGDYVLQTDHQALTKTQRWGPAVAHGATYTLPHALITQSPAALVVIFGTHVVIDHYRLARYVAWAKNQLAPRTWRYSLAEAGPHGYPYNRPDWMAVWLMILADNALHLAVNAAAVVWL